MVVMENKTGTKEKRHLHIKRVFLLLFAGGKK